MKSVFNESSVILRGGSHLTNSTLLRGLADEGFVLQGELCLASTTLAYPLYTNATEAKQLYRQVQNDLKLKLATNKTS